KGEVNPAELKTVKVFRSRLSRNVREQREVWVALNVVKVIEVHQTAKTVGQFFLNRRRRWYGRLRDDFIRKVVFEIVHVERFVAIKEDGLAVRAVSDPRQPRLGFPRRSKCCVGVLSRK